MAMILMKKTCIMFPLNTHSQGSQHDLEAKSGILLALSSKITSTKGSSCCAEGEKQKSCVCVCHDDVPVRLTSKEGQQLGPINGRHAAALVLVVAMVP